MKNLVKKTSVFIAMISVLILSAIPVQATTTGSVNAEIGVVMRKGPGTDYAKIITVPFNGGVTIKKLDVKTNDGSDGCTTGLWYEVTYNNYTGYVCSRFIDINPSVEIPDSDMAKMTDSEFDKYLTSQGFPDTYKTKLKSLHKAHPNWVFVGVKARDTWSNLLKQENVSGRNLYQSTSTSTQGYLSTDDAYYNWYTDTFKKMEGSTWYQANSQTVQYYMDPRNFLTESGIFMFEKLTYNSAFQTSDVVENVVNSSLFKPLIPYFMEAAEKYDVSPVFLAAKSRQEVGLNGGVATNGKGGTSCGHTEWNNYYNFYAIGAKSGVCDGIQYAYNQGWNTKKKAIVDGAKWIVDGYIKYYQDTTYFQKFNTSSKSKKDLWHQYAADVRYASSTAATTKSTYTSMGLTDYPYVFDIPIYSGIPTSTSLPKTGNPNNYLKTLKVNNAKVTNFDGNTTSYTVNVPHDTTSVTIAATTVNTGSKISINSGSKVAKSATSTLKITSDTTDTTVVVTAGNGNKKTYKLKIVRLANTTNDKTTSGNESSSELTPDQTIKGAGYKIKSSTYMYNITLGSTISGTIKKLQKANSYASINITNNKNKAKTSGSLVTGDKVTIASNKNSKTYTVIIYGDTNGDGEITIVDLGKIQKHLLKSSTLTGVYLKAADTDKNGSVSVVDLGKIQKHLLKSSNISQS